jgi:hypothetical protein
MADTNIFERDANIVGAAIIIIVMGSAYIAQFTMSQCALQTVEGF